MQTDQENNSQELNDFVSKHKLRNRHSIIHFNSIVNITTAENKIVNRKMEIIISFKDYNSMGIVTLMASDLDPFTYPTKFEAKWQKMEHVEGEYLKISDTHKTNSAIGKYSVKVLPLERLKD